MRMSINPKDSLTTKVYAATRVHCKRRGFPPGPKSMPRGNRGILSSRFLNSTVLVNPLNRGGKTPEDAWLVDGPLVRDPVGVIPVADHLIGIKKEKKKRIMGSLDSRCLRETGPPPVSLLVGR